VHEAKLGSKRTCKTAARALAYLGYEISDQSVEAQARNDLAAR
jgi:hypothetical protein